MIWVENDAVEQVRRIGLREVADAWNRDFPSEVVNDRGDRQVLRIEIEDQGVFYLKRWRFPHRSKFRVLPGGGDLRRRARDEFENLRVLKEAGIRAPRPLAFGEEKGLWGPVASFLLLEELSGFVCVFEELREHPDDWRKIVRGIATLMADLHARHLYYRSPGLKHFYLKPGREEFALLDVARLDKRKPGPVRRFLKKLGREIPCEERDLSKLLLPLCAAVPAGDEAKSLFWEVYFGRRPELPRRTDLRRRVEIELLRRRTARVRRSQRKST